MRKLSTIKYCSLAFYIILMLLEEAVSAPCTCNYENSSEEAENPRGQEFQIKNRSLDVRDLYDLLLKKQILDEQLNQPRHMVRKSNRSPSLRLRFGKRRDPYATNGQLIGGPYQFFEDLDN